MITCNQLADNIAAFIASNASLQGLHVYRERYRETDEPGYPVAVITAEGGNGLARWNTDAVNYAVGLVIATDPSDAGTDNTFAPVYDSATGVYAPPLPAGFRTSEEWLHLVLDELRKGGLGGILEDAEYELVQADSYPLTFAAATLSYRCPTTAFPASIAPLPPSSEN